MNTGGEAAEQIVRMSLEGFEVAAKITGAGAKNIAILLYSILKEENAPNPSVAKTEKSPLSEPTSEQPRKSAEGATMTKDEKPSVREELRKIKESRKEQEADASPTLDKEKSPDRAKKPPAGKTEHKQPQRKKKKPKSKETR